jgi:hypothetical protein
VLEESTWISTRHMDERHSLDSSDPLAGSDVCTAFCTAMVVSRAQPGFP